MTAAANDGSDDLTKAEAAAKEAQGRRDWPAALTHWEACLGAAPNHPRAFAWRGGRASALVECGRYMEAELEFTSLARGRPASPIGFVGQARVAQAQKNWILAIERWDECLRNFPGEAGLMSWHQSRAGALKAAGRLVEAEDAYRFLATSWSDNPTGHIGQARVAQERRDWATAAALWDACIARFPADAAISSWRMARANCYVKIGRLSEAKDEFRVLATASANRAVALAELARVAEARKDWPAALEAWDKLVGIPEVRQRALAGRANCIVEMFGPSERAERAVEEALAGDPDDPTALSLHARLAMRSSDYRLAMARWTSFAERHPNKIMPYRHCVEAAYRSGDPEFATSLIDRAPPDLANSTAFKCGVRLPYHRRRGETGLGLAIVKEIDGSVIDSASAGFVCMYLNETGLFEETERFGREILKRFPADKSLIELYLAATRLGSGATEFEAEKRRLLLNLPEAVAAPILSKLQPAWLTTEDAKRVIDWMLASPMSDARKANQLLGIAFHPDPETLSYLAGRLGGEGDVAFRLFGRLLLAAVRDQHRIARANVGGVALTQFEGELASLRRDTSELLASPAARQLPRRLLETAAQLDLAGSRSRSAWCFTGESWYEAATLAAWLAGRIAEGKPTSVIRLGDGEGNFLPYTAEDAVFQADDQRHIQHTWWGAAKLSAVDAADLASRLEASIRRADAVGVPPLKRLLKDLNNPTIDGTPNCRGLISAIEYVARQSEEESKNRILVSLHLHSDLDRWDLFRQVFAPVSSVSVVSCLDLSRLLAERFGVGVRCWFRIPPEHRYRALLAEPGYEPERPFYPDLFKEIMAQVAPQPGELFLVAAGFLGKLICDRIRERGGIGFDIGSQADSWMGYATRFYTGAALEFDAASSLIEGQPFPDRFDMTKISKAEPCRSDQVRRTNLTGRFDALLDRPTPESPNYALRVIGHPRCGSTYVAVVLSALGMQIGHELPSANGLSSWIHAVEDRNPPYEAFWLPSRLFRGTMGYVRDPATALPSIMLENTIAASWAFRRFHIARELGIDIALRRDPFERAVESYLCWTEIVERQQPIITLRVERLLEDVAAHAAAFEALGLRVEPAALVQAATVPRNMNDSHKKFALEKPKIEMGRVASLPTELRDGLTRFCERYAYPIPL